MKSLFFPESNKSILFNTLVQVAGKGIFGLSGLFLVAYLTRHLGPAGFGVCVTLFAWVSTVIVLADLGLYLTGVRKFSLSSEKFKTTCKNLLPARLVTCITALFIAGLLLLFIPYSTEQTKLILLSLPSVLFISWARAYKSWFQARLVMHFPALAEVSGCLMMVAVTVAGIQNAKTMEESLYYIVLGLNSGAFLYLMLAFFFAWRTGYPGFRFQINEIVRIIKEAAPLGLSALLAILYFRFDMLMLSWMKPVSHVGVYGSAYTIVEISAVLPAIFLGSMIPLFVSSLNEKMGDIRYHYQNAFSILFVVAVPMTVGGLVLADPIMTMIRGESTVFAGSTSVFQILLLVSVLMFWGQLNGHILVSGGKQGVILKIYLILVPLNIALNLLLIPPFSYTGAAVATLTSELFAIVFTSKIIHREYGLFPNLGFVPGILACAFLMAIFLVLLNNLLDLNVLALIATGAVLYSLFMFIFWRERVSALLKAFL